MNSSPEILLKNIFTISDAKPKCKKNRKRPVPISIRVTTGEKEQLQRAAGTLAISAYIRQKLFGDNVAKREIRYLKKQRQPKIDTQEIARLLGTFGKSELARSILALSLAAQIGDLDVTPDVSDKLKQTCDDIHEIKVALIIALGIKPQETYR